LAGGWRRAETLGTLDFFFSLRVKFAEELLLLLVVGVE
jgi:hypothetical protein